MKYQSTRGGDKGLKFSDAILRGLAHDGGLLVPETIPKIEKKELMKMKDLSYVELGEKIFRYFIDENEVNNIELKEILGKTYGKNSSFNGKGSEEGGEGEEKESEVCKLKKLTNQIYLLELFHGPTLSFKDVALQCLANWFQLFLSREKRNVTVLGATSGDTGSAAVKKENSRAYINSRA